jgi:hypothetical protein
MQLKQLASSLQESGQSIGHSKSHFFKPQIVLLTGAISVWKGIKTIGTILYRHCTRHARRISKQ